MEFASGPSEFVPIDFGRAVLTAGLEDGGYLINYLQNGDKIIAMGGVRSSLERSLGKYEGLWKSNNLISDQELIMNILKKHQSI